MADKKDPGALLTIREAALMLGVPQHVLRFWETRFNQIKPMKRAGGRRYYRPRDMALLQGIQYLLYEQGFTIKGVKKILREQGIKYVISIVSERGDVSKSSPVPPLSPPLTDPPLGKQFTSAKTTEEPTTEEPITGEPGVVPEPILPELNLSESSLSGSRLPNPNLQDASHREMEIAPEPQLLEPGILETCKPEPDALAPQPSGTETNTPQAALPQAISSSQMPLHNNTSDAQLNPDTTAPLSTTAPLLKDSDCEKLNDVLLRLLQCKTALDQARGS